MDDHRVLLDGGRREAGGVYSHVTGVVSWCDRRQSFTIEAPVDVARSPEARLLLTAEHVINCLDANGIVLEPVCSEELFVVDDTIRRMVGDTVAVVDSGTGAIGAVGPNGRVVHAIPPAAGAGRWSSPSWQRTAAEHAAAVVVLTYAPLTVQDGHQGARAERVDAAIVDVAAVIGAAGRPLGIRVRDLQDWVMVTINNDGHPATGIRDDLLGQAIDVDQRLVVAGVGLINDLGPADVHINPTGHAWPDRARQRDLRRVEPGAELAL